MKLLALIVIAVCIGLGESWRGFGGFGGRWGGGFGGWGRGWGGGWGGYGRFGYGRFGYGGFGYGYRPWYGYGYGLGYAYPYYGYGYGYPYYGYGYYRRDVNSQAAEPTIPRPECVFNSTSSLFGCSIGSAIVQCEAKIKVDTATKFGWFAIQPIVSIFNTTTPIQEDFYFNLYPRNEDNTQWLNHTILENGKSLNFGLYHQANADWNGIQIGDSGCYNDLIEFFSRSEFNSSIPLINNTVYGFEAANVTVVGDILLVA